MWAFCSFFFYFSRKPTNIAISQFSGSSSFQVFGSSWPALCTKFQLKKLTLAFPFFSYILHFNISPFLISCFSPLLQRLCPRTCAVPFAHRMCYKHKPADTEKNIKPFGKWSRFWNVRRPWMSIRLQIPFSFATSRHAWLIDRPILP